MLSTLMNKTIDIVSFVVCELKNETSYALSNLSDTFYDTMDDMNNLIFYSKTVNSTSTIENPQTPNMIVSNSPTTVIVQKKDEQTFLDFLHSFIEYLYLENALNLNNSM